MEDYHTGPDTYLRLVRQAKQSLTIPVIGSLNGTSNGGWIHYGRMIEEAGADALELNIYYLPTDPDTTALQVENQYLELVSGVRGAVSIPLAVKIGPVLQLDSQHGQEALQYRGRRPGPVQPVPPA